jgi:hypothetical protein
MTSGIYDDRYTCWNSCAANAGNIRVCLMSSCADADRVRFARYGSIANIDVVIASREFKSSIRA